MRISPEFYPGAEGGDISALGGMFFVRRVEGWGILMILTCNQHSLYAIIIPGQIIFCGRIAHSIIVYING